MTIILPMAGKGERYVKRGYTTPKPLIKIGETPMVIKAVNDLPEADKYLFIVLKQHLEQQAVDDEIRSLLPNSVFIVLDEVTEGQASTCLAAAPFIENNEEVLIGACDNGMIYDKDAFELAKQDADAIIFTFRNNVTVVGKPEQYGWVMADGESNATYISVKKPISETPIRDHAVIGAFWFREMQIFEKAAQKMIAENRRINNEFYVDECMNDAIELGFRVKAFEVEKYICWGTPDDFETYNYWRSFFVDKKIIQ